MFRGTKAQEEKLLSVIEKYRDTEGFMMPILQEAQEIDGYLPIEVMRIIAKETDTSVEEVFGVASFYSQFSLNPKGQVAISVCLGTACYLKGGDMIVEELGKELGLEVGGLTEDGRFSLEAVRCVGCCGLAPVMTISGEVFGKVSKNQISGILDKFA